MQRRAIQVRGLVQGVGFRPFVHRLAVGLGLGGFVRNNSGSVRIEVEGEPDRLEQFLRDLTAQPPAPAMLQEVSCAPVAPLGEREFRIETSGTDADGTVFIPPDSATCADCLRELLDPADRRFRYPFINCTRCGPRLTIITGAPYDRPRTTMAGFAMCAACRAEYEDPADRRFHAQPIACPVCGPRLRALNGAGRPVDEPDPIAWLAAELTAGRIAAVKGLGGYHLACNAADAAAVGRLRQRKHREEKPFAVMVRDLAAAEALCEIGPAERDLLLSPAAPIVLLCKRMPFPLAEAVAPGNPRLGVMLPYTPLHHLLLRAVGFPLVMTSGNRSDEPIAVRDEEAVERLAGIADVVLAHDRPIQVRCDDSVTRVVAGQETPLRRSRGYAPLPVRLPFECPRPILAVGGQLKSTFALGSGRQAFISHHLGDLDHFDAYRAFVEDIARYGELFDGHPAVLAHDLHPDYASTRYAVERADGNVAELIAVQHHHAHLASCMAEHGLSDPVIGVAFDGAGYGSDGAIWGGEVLVGDCRGFTRFAHLRYVGMPGGEKAVREPWRMALAHLHDAGIGDWPGAAQASPVELRAARAMLERRLNTPPTSSAGRLFDAVAALAGVRSRVSYEGQAAIELEWLAERSPADAGYPFGVAQTPGGPLQADARPLIRAVADDAAKGAGAERIARRFHSALVDLVCDLCGRCRASTGLDRVVLTGGVFLNALLSREAAGRLTAEGFRVHRHRLLPPGDGGLSLGQLAVAAARSAAAAL